MTAREDTIERIERVLKLTHKKSITVTIPRLTAERAVSMLKEQKPPLGVKPYYIAAWQRIGELTEAIERQYESADGDAGLVEKWANEIGWQASMIEALTGEQDEQPK